MFLINTDCYFFATNLIWNESLEPDVFDGNMFSGVAFLPEIITDILTASLRNKSFSNGKVENIWNLQKLI